VKIFWKIRWSAPIKKILRGDVFIAKKFDTCKILSKKFEIIIV
jgi:hypothetical protein